MEEEGNSETRQPADRRSATGRRSRRFAAYSIAAIAALLGTAVLAVVVLGPESNASVGTTEAAAPEQQTAFAFFDEFHATLILTPGTTGENTVELNLATHDGSGAPDVSEVSVAAALPSAGIEPTTYPAEPVAGSPGAFRAAVLLPEPGEWELTVSVAGAEPAAETAVVPIGAR